MKKLIALLLVLAISSAAGAGTTIVSGLPATVNTMSGPTVLSFDIVSNGQLDNASLYIWTYTGGTLDIASAVNRVVADDSLYDDSPLAWLLDYIPDITGISSPIIWADIAIPKAIPDVIVGDIISDLGLTIEQGFVGMLDVKVLSENTGVVEGMFTVDCVPEPVTIALLGLGGLFLRRRK